jgi:hypothetical protein
VSSVEATPVAPGQVRCLTYVASVEEVEEAEQEDPFRIGFEFRYDEDSNTLFRVSTALRSDDLTISLVHVVRYIGKVIPEDFSEPTVATFIQVNLMPVLLPYIQEAVSSASVRVRPGRPPLTVNWDASKPIELQES